MPLIANAVFTFVNFAVNQDGTVTLYLTCANPGESMPGDYTMTLTAANITTIAGAGSQTQQLTALATIVRTYLIANYRRPATAIDTRLSTLVGNTLTVP